jgi:hypothetical protein
VVDPLRQCIRDVVDPVAGAAGEQVVDHSRGTGPNAVFELGDRPWGESTRDEFSVLALLRRVQRDDGRIRREKVGRLDERALAGGERIGVAVQPHSMPVLGCHPEIPLDGFLDTRCQPVAEQRSGAAKLGEQLVGKAIAPQCEIRQIDCRSRHSQPRLIRTLTPRGGRVCNVTLPPASARVDVQCLK